MNYIQLIRSVSELEARSMAVYAILDGIFRFLIIAVVSFAASEAFFGEVPVRSLLMYLVCVVVFLLADYRSMTASSALTEAAVERIRQELAGKIRSARLETIERIGASRIGAIFTKETTALSEGAPWLVSCIASAALLVSSLIYIGFLVPSALHVAVLVTAGATAWYVYSQDRVQRELVATTDKEAEFLDVLVDLTQGSKELKLDDRRSDDFFHNRYRNVVESAERLQNEIQRKFSRNAVASYAVYLSAVGGVAFGLPLIGVTDPAKIFQISAVLLYILGPLDTLVYGLPLIEKASASATAIEALQKELVAEGPDMAETVPPFLTETGFRKIAMDGIQYSYSEGHDATPFSVGPLDLELERGETVFLVGGNGSGKTTLVKILTGLYVPRRGLIRRDGVAVTPETLQRYRELFSPVFTDFHLFDRLYACGDAGNRRVDELLEEMKLDGVTAFDGGRFSRLDLSTGQRKRLAMAVAILEDRPILVLDEPAADQDPDFRKYIYEVLFRKLKERGKTIFAVTHDENYFSTADRVLRMEYGQIRTAKQMRFLPWK